MNRIEIERIRRRARRLLELKAQERKLALEIRKTQSFLKEVLGEGGVVTLPKEQQELVVQQQAETMIPQHTRAAHSRIILRKRSTRKAVKKLA